MSHSGSEAGDPLRHVPLCSKENLPREYLSWLPWRWGWVLVWSRNKAQVECGASQETQLQSSLLQLLSFLSLLGQELWLLG